MSQQWINGFGSLFLTLLVAASLVGCGGSSSSSSSGGSGAGPELDAPQGLKAAAGDGNVDISWSGVEDATAYNLYYATAESIDIDNPGLGDGEVIQGINGPYLLTGLENQTDYYFVVTATAGNSESPPSDEVSARPAKGVAGRQMEGEVVTLAAGSYQRLIIGCTDDDAVVVYGGAFLTPVEDVAEPELRIQQSGPNAAGDNWIVGVSNAGTQSKEVVGFAICIQPPEDYEIVSDDMTLPAGGWAQDTVSCPGSGQVVLGGGASVLGMGGTEPQTRVQVTAPAGWNSTESQYTSWRVGMTSQAGSSVDVRLRAICALPPRGMERVGSNIAQLESGEYAAGNAYCSDWDKVTLGGTIGRPSGTLADEAGTELQQTRPRNGPNGLGGWNMGSSNVSATTLENLRLLVACVDEAP